MTPEGLKTVRRELGHTQASLAAALELGPHGARTVRRWELGERPIPGPVAVLVRLWLKQATDLPKA